MTTTPVRTFLRGAAVAGLAAALALLPGMFANGQDKSSPVSKVERLNRAPVNKEPLKVNIPRPAVIKLPNGMTLVLLEDHKLPTVTFAMWIRPGQLADPNDLPGLASFTADMLDEGTEKRTSVQISAEVDALGATLNAGSRFGASYTSVTASGFSENTPQILDLLSDITLHPSFPASELAKYKQREEAGMESRLSNPGFLAQRAYRRAVYGDGPLSVISPTKESIAKVTPDDLKRFHAQHFRPGNTLFGVTGDFKTADMRAAIEKYFGAWSGAAEPLQAFPARPAGSPTKIILVDRPGSVQTFFMAGNRAIRRTDPEFYNLMVMNRVLGGGAQARLFLDLREEHGYTYGAYSNINVEMYPGDWVANTSVRTAVTDGSMTQLVYEFKRINNEPVPASEMEDARHALVASFALALEQPAQMLANWLTVQYYGLPADYWDKYPDRIAAVDSAAVQSAAKQFVDLDHMQWIAVGDRKQIEQTLAKYGPVTVVDVEGKVQP